MMRNASASFVLAGALVGCSPRGDVQPSSETHDGSDVEPSADSAIGAEPLAPRGPQVAAGRAHSCAITEGDRVVCWGANASGQAGSFAGETVAPSIVEGVGAHAITATGDHTCVLGRAGELVCWGSGRDGQLGGPSGAQPVRLGDSASFVRASAGALSSCGVVESGEIHCWGRPRTAYAGIEPAMHEVPIEGATGVSIGSPSMGCALHGAGEVSCWRWQSTGNPAYALERVALDGSLDVGAGESFACALGQDRLVRCWGSNAWGVLGLPPDPKTIREPRVVPGVTDVEQLAVGATSACARQGDGAVWCWGSNAYGQLGRKGGDRFGAPGRVADLPAAIDLDVGGAHACAVTEAREVHCWGRADEGQLGTGTEHAVATTPIHVEHVARATEVAHADVEICAIAKAKGVVCWNVPTESSVHAIARTEHARALALISGGGCALVDGTARCWGQVAWEGHEPGEKPDFTARDVDGPARLTTLAGDARRTICGVEFEGTVWCWGSMGDPDSEETFVYGPAELGELPGGAVELALQPDGLVCARRRDGRVICWMMPGRNRKPMYATVVGPRNVVSLVAGAETCALTDTGALWCWDRNVAAHPVPLPAGPATAIAIGDEHGCALLENEQVACWGNGERGQLGNGRVDLLPSIVRGLEGIESISAAGDRTCARKGDGSIHCWGAPDPAGRVPAWTSKPGRVPLPT